MMALMISGMVFVPALLGIGLAVFPWENADGLHEEADPMRGQKK